MQTLDIIYLAGTTLGYVGAFALGRHARPEVTSPKHALASYRDSYPAISEVWRKDEPITGEYIDNRGVVRRTVLSVEDTPLAKLPPNIGGVGNPPYQGPNYVTPLEVAEEMKGIWHFGQDDDSDLAFQYSPGRVAPDGSIWLGEHERLKGGVAMIPVSEQMKAARFGWEYDGPADVGGFVRVWRERGI